MKKLKYYLVKDPAGDGYIAKTIIDRVYDEEDLIKRMCRNDRSLDEDKVRKIFRVYMETYKDLLSQGYTV